MLYSNCSKSHVYNAKMRREKKRRQQKFNKRMRKDQAEVFSLVYWVKLNFTYACYELLIIFDLKCVYIDAGMPNFVLVDTEHTLYTLYIYLFWWKIGQYDGHHFFLAPFCTRRTFLTWVLTLKLMNYVMKEKKKSEKKKEKQQKESNESRWRTEKNKIKQTETWSYCRPVPSI